MKKPLAAGLLVLLAACLWARWGDTWVRNPPMPLRGAEIRSTRLPDAAGPGVQAITLLLDNGRGNRLNARREARLLEGNPNAFGTNAPFKPLVTIAATGPGNIMIDGSGPTETIAIPIGTGSYQIEVYPHFNLAKLKSGTAGEAETLNFVFEPERGKAWKAAEETITWSGPSELFLSTKNLSDIAAFLTELPEGKTPPENITKWLEERAHDIREANLAYETPAGDHGWQKIRNETQCAAEGEANCLDLAVQTARAAKLAGLAPILIANPGHALCAVGRPDAPPEMAVPFEGTMFLNTKKTPQPRRNEQNQPAPSPGNRNPPRAPEPPEIFAIELKKWEPYFRRAPESKP